MGYVETEYLADVKQLTIKQTVVVVYITTSSYYRCTLHSQ